MSDSTAIERRLIQVEKELADLKLHVQELQPKTNWIDAITGTFQDDTEFDEILRLGKEIRNADTPKKIIVHVDPRYRPYWHFAT